MTFARLRGLGGSLLTWLSSRRTKAFLLVAVLVVGIFVVGDSASAFSLSEIKEWLFGLFGQILAFLIDLLAKLIIIFVNVLIEFAKYNGFVNAAPVVVGWVLVRDVVNMFFIVILLVSAFSTIIGYSDFHYTKVLPKLLLMAVLINFSKTFLGLMIDFSQVLMLTFVNAFAPAAGGNFVTMLKLTKITELRTDLQDAAKVSDLIIASLLGIIMLSIVLTIVVIMIAFLIYRILLLWMLLIMSPMAFFALSLPGKLSKGMAPFTSKFWERLSSALIGGPVMAFFLWLALSIAQNGTGYNGLYNKTQTTEISAAEEFVSRAGEPAELASFVVAVGFLLAGVEFAVSTSASLSPALGKFASGVSSNGGAVFAGLRAAQRTARVAGKTVRTTGAAFGAVGRGADAVSGGRLSTLAGRAGLKVSPTSATFAQLAETRNRQSKAKGAALNKSFEGVNLATRDNALRKMGSPEAQILLAQTAGTGPGLKNRQALIQEALKSQNPDLNKDELAALTEARALDQAAADLKAGKAAAEKTGDDASLTKFKEAIEKNPSLNADWTAFSGIKGASIEDPKKYMEKLTTESVKDSRTALAHMSALGMIDANGNFVRNASNEETWKMALTGDRGKILQAHVDAYQGAAGAAKVQAQLRAIDGSADAVDAANRGRHYATVKDGLVGSVFVAPGGPNAPGERTRTAVGNVQQNVQVRNEQQIAQGAERLRAFAANNVPPTAPEAQSAQRTMLASGATLAEAFNFGQNAEFADRANRNAFQGVMTAVSDGLAQGEEEALGVIRNLDTKSLTQKPEEYNEARSVAVASLTPDALRRTFEAAQAGNDQQLRSKVIDLLDMVDQEANRVKQITSKAGGRRQLVEVASGVDSPTFRESVQKMVEGGAENPQRAVEAAHAAILSQQLGARDDFRSIRNEVGARAERAAQRTQQAREASLRRRRGDGNNA